MAKNWFNEARFGLFLHWGAYSVAGRGEWILNREHISYAEYEEKYVRKFTVENYDPETWAQLACDAGMKYVVLTTKHHDGFCLWDTDTTDFNAAKTGPGKDLILPYVEAVRKAGLKVGLYYSVADWHHPDYPGAYHRDWPEGWPSEEQRLRFVDYYHSQVKELMTRYGKIDILWWDGTFPQPLDGNKINEEAKKLQPHILINPSNGEPSDFGRCEQKIIPDPSRIWEACFTLWHPPGSGWCYHPYGHDYRSPRQVLDLLINCAANGGNLLLNVGPAPDGTIPEKEVAVLRRIGDWLKLNGESIYGSSRSPFSFNCMGKMTVKDKCLYFHFFNKPTEAEFCLAEFGNRVQHVYYLESNEPIPFRQDGPRLYLEKLQIPERPFTPITIAIEFDDVPKPFNKQTNSWLDQPE